MKEIEYKFILKKTDLTKLRKFLKDNNAELLHCGEQDNFYYIAPGKNDLRVRRTENEAFLILKHGWMHDEDRLETEIKVSRNDFKKLDLILTSLGYKYDTKWYRKREHYKFGKFNIDIDFNAGYGWIAEIELLVRQGGEEKAKAEILNLAKQIGLKPASKDLFDKMYHFYKKNWKHYYESKDVFDIEKLK